MTQFRANPANKDSTSWRNNRGQTSQANRGTFREYLPTIQTMDNQRSLQNSQADLYPLKKKQSISCERQQYQPNSVGYFRP